MSRDQPVRMVLLGGIHVGKSSLALRFAKGNYIENHETTIGAAFLTQKFQLDAETILKLEIWDTAGQERYHSLTPMYYRGAQAAIVVYNIIESESFRRAKLWVRELREANGNDMVIGIAGNKLDLANGNQRQVTYKDAAEYAQENNLIFIETSAKQNENVNEIFHRVARQAALKQNGSKPNATIRASELAKKGKDEKTGCCIGKGHAEQKKTSNQ